MKAMIDLMKTMMLMPKPWQMWLGILIAANILVPLFYLHTLEGKVILASIIVGMMIMTAIFKAKGFVRLLGIGHIAWLPLVPWLWTRLDDAPAESIFGYWLMAVMVLNSLSLIIDTVDLIRYIRGERAPSLFFAKQNPKFSAGRQEPNLIHE